MDDRSRHKEDAELGLQGKIDRRDFVGMVLAGSAAFAGWPGFGMADETRSKLPDADGWSLNAADFDGFGGAGDYAFSNGNTWNVANAAHRVRDRKHRPMLASAIADTGEVYDLVVVGGGPAGLASAYHFRKTAGDKSRCLVLDNHNMFGGLAKRNEMTVDGVRLMAPQGSNVFSSAGASDERFVSPDILDDIGLTPGAIEYGALSGTDKRLEFDRTNFVYYYPPHNSESLGYFANARDGYRLLQNPWSNGFRDAPYDNELRNELMRWRFDTAVPADWVNQGDADRRLDTMTYQQYLQGEHGFSTQLCNIINQYIGGGKAFNGEICSAYALSFNAYPGLTRRQFRSIEETYRELESGPVRADGFPGGNAMVARYFAKYLVPDLIAGDASPDNIVNNPVRMAALDQPNQPTRIRLGATVVAVSHLGPPEKAREIEVIYELGGTLQKLRAKRVVMASGAWINKYVLRDAPVSLRSAMGQLRHAPMLVANVALRNWRFMEKAGVTACLWDKGAFGFQCNLRQPMHEGDYAPPLDPSRPIFLTFYAPFVYPGNSAAAQTTLGRAELLTTSFSEFEARIRRQLTDLFGDYGFDAARDIAGIILNRWGHAYVVPEPGFFFGRNGQPSPRDIIRQGYGRVAFAHSELYGFQSIQTAVHQAEAAVARVL